MNTDRHRSDLLFLIRVLSVFNVFEAARLAAGQIKNVTYASSAAVAIRATLGPLPATPLAEGVRATIERFAELQSESRLDTSDLDQ